MEHLPGDRHRGDRAEDRLSPGVLLEGCNSVGSAWESEAVSGRWRLEERMGKAAELHASWPEVEARPDVGAVALCRVTDTAVVLGSTQSESVVDHGLAAASGVSVARRRSGGGAVLVTPDDPVWIDVWVPVDDGRWERDVSRSFDWLGDAWAEALRRCGVGELHAHRAAYLACTPWSGLVCFGGVGRGEVVTSSGRKVVGLSQRRDRRGSWFTVGIRRSWWICWTCPTQIGRRPPLAWTRRWPESPI